MYQHKSQDENDRDKKGELLDTALKRAGQSLNALLGSATGEFFLDLCRTYLLLAGLHRCRQDACDDAENSEEFKKYLSKARALLDERKPVRLGEGRGLEVVPGACPNACYEEACYRVLLEDLDTSGADLVNDLLYAAIRVQPGWYNRAGTDFRLEPFREDERQWKILGERLREPHIIGGKEEQT
ncbi:MAG: hypothetical protein U9R15_17260 [Chloroflexota bacterium]|nr:hypothetical protein [Chloroflexota bacterium]